MHPSTEFRFDTYSSYRATILEALGLAQRRVAIFDFDLVECGLESRETIAQLERLCVSSPHEYALRILLADASHLIRNCPRLTAFLLRFGHRAAIRLADPDARLHSRNFLIGDDAHVVTRFHRDHPRGRFNRADTSAAACFITQFETIWIKGEPLAIGVALGI